MRLPIYILGLLLCVLLSPLVHADVQAIESIVDRKADENGVPSSLVKAIITVESGWHSAARNGSSIGLMQITPGTARALGFRGTLKELFDPETNIGLGTLYLAQAYRLAEGDLCATITRYQSGLDATRANGANRAYCKKLQGLLTP